MKNLLAKILDAIDPPRPPIPYTVPRGSLASSDPAVHWLIFSDSCGGDREYVLRCTCGLHKLADEQEQHHQHDCGGTVWDAILKLEGHGTRNGWGRRKDVR